MSATKLIALAALAVGLHAQAQTLSTSGALVVVPAMGEVTKANDEAIAVFSVEEQDRDKAAAASRVNAKMREGTELLKKADPQAKLKTYGYYTYPVYPEDRPPPPGTLAKPRVATAWRVGQYLELRTTNLRPLPATVASAQKILALNNLRFGLSPAATRAMDEERIGATYKDLNERVAAIARAMGRPLSDAVLDTVDFEGSGNYMQRVEVTGARVGAAPMAKAGGPVVEEPSFEPGETTLQMRVVGKVKFR